MSSLNLLIYFIRSTPITNRCSPLGYKVFCPRGARFYYPSGTTLRRSSPGYTLTSKMVGDSEGNVKPHEVAWGSRRQVGSLRQTSCNSLLSRTHTGRKPLGLSFCLSVPVSFCMSLSLSLTPVVKDCSSSTTMVRSTVLTACNNKVSMDCFFFLKS